MRSGHRVIEVSPEKEVVWSVGQYELPGIQLSWVATCTERPNGNIVISNCFAVNAAACKRSLLDWAGLLTPFGAVLQGNAPPGSGYPGGLHPSLIEVTHDEAKEVVWSFHHAEVTGLELSIGDTAVSQVLEAW